MKTIVMLITLLNFLIFIVGAFTVFSKPQKKEKNRAISSFLILCCMLYLLILGWFSPAVPIQYILIGFMLNFTSVCLFFYTAQTVRQHYFSPIYSQDTPITIITHGPYRYVRHPFYTSYLLAFGAAALYTYSFWSLPATLLIYTIYQGASEQEELKFFRSELKDDYLDYMQRIGRFYPWFF